MRSLSASKPFGVCVAKNPADFLSPPVGRESMGAAPLALPRQAGAGRIMMGFQPSPYGLG
jgi:hypothetical protein